MAADTPVDVRSLVIYQVFPRNHGPSGTLRDVIADIDRIAALGVDVLYLLPIHPIGVAGRKGSAGSPYAIRDYRRLNPDLGPEEDFDALVATAHAAGLRVMIDVVANHTSPDNVLVAGHPEFYRRDAAGRPHSSVPAWSDVVDLDHPRADLTRYLIDSLAFWVRRGVDGFRCDVASLVPLEFWVQARAELAQIRPGLLWLAETGHPGSVERRRAAGTPTPSDAEMYEAFDVEYPYDTWSIWQSVVRGHEPVGRYLEVLRWQDGTLPANYAKVRFVENHDNYRIMAFAPTRAAALAWTALAALARGPLLYYAGQESAARSWPSLFEPDPVRWGTYELSGYLSALAALKKHPAMRRGELAILADEPCVQLVWGRRGGGAVAPFADSPALYAIVNVTGVGERIPVQLPDGDYADLLGGGAVRVVDSQVRAPESAVVLEVRREFDVDPWRTPLLDVFLHVEKLGDRIDGE